MDPLFTEEQLNKMSREDIISLMKTMRSGNSLAHPAKNMRMAIRS